MSQSRIVSGFLGNITQLNFLLPISANCAGFIDYYIQKAMMSQLKKRIHLFNCDNTYKLDPVENLLEKCGSHVKRIEKHYFRLPKMSEMVDRIPTLEIDMAFFVVHAHECVLSINEDDAGIGYTKIYRALLQATGEELGYFSFFLSLFIIIKCVCLKHF